MIDFKELARVMKNGNNTVFGRDEEGNFILGCESCFVKTKALSKHLLNVLENIFPDTIPEKDEVYVSINNTKPQFDKNNLIKEQIKEIDLKCDKYVISKLSDDLAEKENNNINVLEDTEIQFRFGKGKSVENFVRALYNSSSKNYIFVNESYFRILKENCNHHVIMGDGERDIVLISNYYESDKIYILPRVMKGMKFLNYLK